MAHLKNKNLGSLKALYNFLAGETKTPTSLEVISCLSRGYITRAEAQKLNKEISRMEDKMRAVEVLTGRLALAKSNTAEELKIIREIKSVLKIR